MFVRMILCGRSIDGSLKGGLRIDEMIPQKANCETVRVRVGGK